MNVFQARSTNGLQIRRATLSDKEGVLRIRGTSGEPDCQASYYEKIVSHPNSETLVAVCNGLIVS